MPNRAFHRDFTPTSIRQWELRARAVDALGRTQDAAITVHVTGPAIPNVTLTSPASGSILTAPATPELTADASVQTSPPSPACSSTMVRLFLAKIRQRRSASLHHH
jgi:hypothetical protein